MNFYRDVVSHLLKNAFEGHTKFSVADDTAVGANPIRSLNLDAVSANDSTIISLSWDGGQKLFEKNLPEQEAAHQFDLISTDLAEVAALTKQGNYDAAKDLMKKLGQKYAENTGDIVDTNLPRLHNTQASLEKKASTDYYFTTPVPLKVIQKIKGLKVTKNNEGSLVVTDGENYLHLDLDEKGLVSGGTRFGANDPDMILELLSGVAGEIVDEHEMQDRWYAEDEAKHNAPGHACDENCMLNEEASKQASTEKEARSRKCPDCGAELQHDPAHSGPWGDFWMCPEHGIVSGQNIVYASSEDDKIWRKAKITMQNLWFSTTDELLDYQKKQKGAQPGNDQDHIPLWDKQKPKTPTQDGLAPASLSYEDAENEKEREHEDMQKHIDDKIKTELESALQEKAASVFGPEQVELVEVLKKNGRNWDEIKNILTKDFHFDKDSVNIFIDEQRQGADPAGIEVEPVKEDKKEEAPLTPPEELVSPETHDKLLQDHEDKKKDNLPVKEPSFTPKDVMDIPETEEIEDHSSMSNEIARADNDEIHKVAAPSDLNPLQEPLQEAPTTPTQDVVPMGKPEIHNAPQKGDRVFVSSDLTGEKAGFEGTFISMYKSKGVDFAIVETDDGDLLDVESHRVAKTSEPSGAQEAEPAMAPTVEQTKDEKIQVTPKLEELHNSAQDDALALKVEAEALLKDFDNIGKIAFIFVKKGMQKEAAQLDSAFEGNAWVRVWVNQDDIEVDRRYAEVLKNPDENARIAALKEIARDIAYSNLHDGVEGASMYADFNVESLSPSRHDRIDWYALANPVDEEEEDRKFEEEMARKYGPDAAIPPKPVQSSLKKQAGTTWHDLRMPEPPQPGWRVQHTSGLTGTVVDGNDKFANVQLDQPIKEDEATCRQYDLSWVQLERGDHPKGVYAIYAGDGFGSWSGSTPNWTMTDSGGKPIYPKGYTPPKPMEHDKNPNPEPAIDTESAIHNGPSDEDVNQKAWEMFKAHWNALSSEQMEQVYKALGMEADASLKSASDFEKGISQNKTSAPEPEEAPKTQFKDVKITPKFVPKEQAIPATPELDAILSKMDVLQQNLATLAAAREQIAAKMNAELAKIDEQGQRVEMEAQLQETVEKSAVLISAVESKIVQWKDKLFTLQTEEITYVPKLSPKEMLAKVYAKFDGAEKYVKDVLNGMLSLGKNVTEKTLYRWPNRKSSLNKEANILDDFNRFNEELLAALQELSSPI